ncbi:heavy metal translocating P-type ATPase [Niabella hirudinis]|uniref:heavy metal translocating P-type ATPase n=1 Tax=Niabella hirudinis TaxID=1285929 RepID=UPI003EBAD321
MIENGAHKKVYCYHCGDHCSDEPFQAGDHFFCCNGCRTVFELLNEKKLCTYYDLNRHPGQQQVRQPRKDRFAFLEKEEIIKDLVSFSDGQQTHVTLNIPHMHCSSCLWLLESIGEMQAGILTSRVNFSEKTVFIIFDNQQCSLRSVVEALTSIGYEPCLDLNNPGKGRPEPMQNRRVLQISIAGFCFANIMMLSLPEYFSLAGYLEERIGNTFRYMGLLLVLPVLFYAAGEFFINAWKGLKAARLNIDFSIALALLLTFSRSCYNLFFLDGATYFDSLSGIVFFMLIGRWAQEKTQRSLVFNRDYTSFFPVSVNVINGGRTLPTGIGALKKNDIIEVFDQEIIPADSLLLQGKAVIDYSFVTGETLPKAVEQGALVYAGGRQIGERLELAVLKPSDQGYLTSLWNREVPDKDKKQNEQLHKTSNYFTLAVLLLTACSAFYWFLNGNAAAGWRVLTTTLIVACPCALLLAATFTNGHVLRIFKKAGLYLKNDGVIGSLAGINQVVLDKTGTITKGDGFKVTYLGHPLTGEERLWVASLLKHATHPLSKAVAAYLNVRNTIPVLHFKNLPGKGVEGWIAERHVKIGSPSFVLGKPDTEAMNATRVFLKIDGTSTGFFELLHRYREDLAPFLKRLQQKGTVSILSGDNNAELAGLQELLGADADIRFYQSPDDKYEAVFALQQRCHKKVLMVGDGLNDAGALRQSDVGIAVSEGAKTFTPASDAILDGAAVTQLDQVLYLAKKSGKVVRISFLVSIIYNIAGLYFALQGQLSPVVAALLMPLSSVSIILLTFFLSEWYGRKLKPVKA